MAFDSVDELSYFMTDGVIVDQGKMGFEFTPLSRACKIGVLCFRNWNE
jgi:hypothetical protein